jgi:hypothetical protein
VLSYEAQYGRWAFLMTIDGPLTASDGLMMDLITLMMAPEGPDGL